MENQQSKVAVQNLRSKEEITDYLLVRTRELCAEQGGELVSRQIKALAQATAEVLAGMNQQIAGKRPW